VLTLTPTYRAARLNANRWAALEQPSVVSLFPWQPHRHLPNRMPKLVAYAHFTATLSHHAPVACETPSHMPTAPQPHRAMLQLLAKRRLACPPRLSLIAPCPLVCESSSRLPTQSQRHGAMPTGVRNVVAHAHLVSASSQRAHSRVERCLGECGQPNQRLQLTPLRVERDRCFFETWLRLDSHLDLSVRRN